MAGDQQFCTFYLGDLYFGIEVQRVQEVLREQPTTRVPLAHPAISGLINLRGQIVEAIELRSRLGFPARDAGSAPMNVVVRTDDGPVSLLADVIGDVVTVEDSGFEPPPDTLDATARELISGVYKMSERLLLVLDTVKVLQLQDVTESETR